MRSLSCNRFCRVESWHLMEPNVGLLQKQDLVLSLLISHQALDIHFSGIPPKRTSKELPGIVLALMLIFQLLLPARWRQLWPLYMLSIWLWLGQVYWTDRPPVISRISGFVWGPLGNASGFIHIQVKWLSNMRKGQGRYQGSFQGFEEGPLLSPSPFQRLRTSLA